MGVETKNEFPFSVDTWTATSQRKPYHFLTHAHKDHTAGIDAHGTFPIYCSSLTQKLVCVRYPKLNPSIFKCLEVGESEFLGDRNEGFTVTAYDANHCPGAIMLLFEGSFGNVLHTGDCRLTSECLNQLAHYISGSSRVLDCVYLDCTFGAQPMVLPSKEAAIEQVKRCIWNHPSEAKVYLACDMLGQEPLLEAIARDFGLKIFVDKDRVSKYYADLEVLAPNFFTTDKESTRFEICESYPRFYEKALETMILAKVEGRVQPLFIRPSTQWYVFDDKFHGEESPSPASFSKYGSPIKRRSAASFLTQATRDEFGVYHVCYSMHSSQIELKGALRFLNPIEVISTTPHCGDLEATSPPMSIVEAIQECILEDREFKKARREYSCSPVKPNVESPCKPIPLFGLAQYVLPPSPSPSSHFRTSSAPLPSPADSSNFRTSSAPLPSPANSSYFRTSSAPLPSPADSVAIASRGVPRAKRLFVDTEAVDSVASPKHLRSVSMPVTVPHEDIHSHNVRSKSLSRLPSRRKFRIPEPLPSLQEMIRNGE